MDGDDELGLRQQHGVGAGLPIRAPKQRAITLVKGKPVVRTSHDVPQVPPAAVKLPEQFQRRHAIERRVQNGRDDCPQVGAFQVCYQPLVDELCLRVRVFAIRCAGPEIVVRAVLDAVFTGQHRRGHLIVRHQLLKDFRILRPLAKHRVGIRELGKPCAHVAKIQPRILARRQLRGQVDNIKRLVRAVREIQSFFHAKSLRFPSA